TPTVFQRLATGFALQGGGTKADGSTNNATTTLASEAGAFSNVTGTIAMALSNGPDSGTNQWFINLANNDGSGSTPALDDASDGGPFTVFGSVIDSGMTVVNQIAGEQIIDASSENSNWGTLPVINYTGAATTSSVPQANLITDNVVVIAASSAVS